MLRLRMIPFGPEDEASKQAMVFLRKSIAVSGGQTESDVVAMLSKGTASLWVLRNERDETLGAVVTSVQSKVLFIVHLAADNFDDMRTCWKELEDFGRFVKAEAIRGRCTPRAARFFNHKLNMETLYCVIEQKLG